jgi:tetratricopeptide (TPR) repeat protein
MNRRYVMYEELGRGGMGVVYRASDRLNSGRWIALKQLHGSLKIGDLDTSQVDARRLVMSREFRILAALRHPNVISVLDYGFSNQEGEPFFTMDLLESPRTILEASEDMDYEQKLELIVQLLEGLAYLHRRGIIHRDLKPDNVLVTTDKTLKILDFGLAQGNVQSSISSDTAERIAGTIPYMAPEIFAEVPVSVASDLYALAVIAYEVIVRRHPISNSTNFAVVMSAILTKEPDLSPLDEQIAPIISRLLSKDPHDRYPNAESVIRALGEAFPHLRSNESVAMRENILQYAPFVGRDAEFKQLKDAMMTMLDIRLQTGSAWLLAGESGVGKSRMLNELRIQAVTRGVFVLNGQAVSEGGAVYELWRQPFRQMAIENPPTMEEASILKSLIPDLEQLIGETILDAPVALNPKIAQERLLNTIESWFSRSKRAILLILEDIHWSTESLLVLKRILPLVNKQALMIVGSYRDDETPELPNQLEGMIKLKLNKLSREAIENLSQAVLGENQHQGAIVEMLARESNGNALFIIEILRSLAESAGSLSMIGKMTLSPLVMAGDMQAILQRRLEKLPQETHQFLQVAALAGRALDLDLLSRLFPELALEEILGKAAEALLLEVSEDRWRFVYDKLREAIIAEIPAETAPLWHRQIAEGMEALYSQDLAKAPHLLYHWQAAGDTAKILHYAQLSGDQAMLNGANLQAKGYYDRALKLLDRLEDTEANQRLFVELSIKLSKVAAYHPEESLTQTMHKSVAVAETLHDELLLARAMGSTGAYHFMLGQIGASMQYFQQSMALAEKLGNEELLLLPYNIIGRSVALAGNFTVSRVHLREGIRLAEKFKDTELLSGSLAFYALSLMLQGLSEEAEPVIQRSIEVAEKVGPSRMTGTLVINGCGRMWNGRWEEAIDFFKKAESLALKINDFLPLYWSRGFLGNIMMKTGDFHAAQEYLDQALGMIEEGKTVFHLPLFQAYRGELYFHQKDVDTALAKTQAALEFGRQTRQELATGEALCTLGKIHSHLKDSEKAEAFFLESIESHNQGGRLVQTAVTHLELGRHYAMVGDKKNAAKALDEAVERFAQYRMAWYLGQARQLRATL